MITLITAPPGSGKTLLAVKMIRDARAKGRAVFSDIAGLNIEGVQPAPADWRETPEGSLVVYDEAQGLFPSTGKPGRPDDLRLQALEVHRHTGHDLVFITQAPTFIHHHIRKLVGEHKHLHRAMGRKGAIIFTWENQVGDADDYHSRNKANQENFTYPKELFSLYKSATVHTHKFKIPSKLLWMAAAVIAIAAYPVYRMATGQFLDFDGQDVAAESIGVQPNAPQAHRPAGPGGGALPTASNPLYAWVHAAPVPSINGCAAGSEYCRCFGMDGLMLDISEGECRVILTRPLPLDLNLFKQSGSSGSVSGTDAPGQSSDAPEA